METPRRTTFTATRHPGHRAGRGRRRRGTVLVTATWVVIILTGLLLVFARSMRVELIAASNRLASEQAAAVERGAEQYVLSLVDGTAGDPSAILSAPAEQMQVGGGYFWIIRPTDDELSYDFGIADESGKLNLNTATAEELVKLPGMSLEVADAIIDWRDTDEQVTNSGAESNYYISNGRYTAKNAGFETIEELRLVKDVNAGLLYGYDLNRDGVISEAEEALGGEATSVNAANAGARGILPYLTVYSSETGSGGAAGGTTGGATGGTTGGTGTTTSSKINVNDQNANNQIRSLFRSAFGESRGDELAGQAARAQRPFANIFDFAVKSGLEPDEFEQIADQITHTNARTRRGLVNVNTASRAVLESLPLMEGGDADALISARGGSGIGWVYGALDPEKAVAIGSRITATSYQYSADIVAISGDGRAFKRVRIVVDGRQTPARVVYRKDLTALGWPLPEELRASLRGSGRQSSPNNYSGGMGG